MDVNENLSKLKNRLGMIIPKDYEKFIQETNIFDYADVIIKVDNIEIEINHFLKVDNTNPSLDLRGWYFFAEPERIDYLTIVMGYGNEEIAIKTLGKDVGGIYFINQAEEEVVIKKLYDNFNDFKEVLVKNKENSKNL